MFAALHSRINVDDLLHGVIIHSGNDACIVLAEGIAGSEAEVAAKMTQRARDRARKVDLSAIRMDCPIRNAGDDHANSAFWRGHHHDLSRVLQNLRAA